MWRASATCRKVKADDAVLRDSGDADMGRRSNAHSKIAVVSASDPRHKELFDIRVRALTIVETLSSDVRLFHDTRTIG